MKPGQRYVGIHKEINGGMTDTAKIIRDAWIFGLIPESETCEGWLAAGIEDLWHKTQAQWEKYGYQVNRLPEEIRTRFYRIQENALQRARKEGWDAELGDNE